MMTQCGMMQTESTCCNENCGSLSRGGMLASRTRKIVKYARMQTPCQINLELTSACNHKCRYCYNFWRNAPPFQTRQDVQEDPRPGDGGRDQEQGHERHPRRRRAVQQLRRATPRRPRADQGRDHDIASISGAFKRSLLLHFLPHLPRPDPGPTRIAPNACVRMLWTI
jgi:hypothetical protein